MQNYEKYITKEDVSKIYAVSLKILKEIGVKFEHTEALDLFKKNGAEVENDIVHIDEKMVEEALKNTPSQFTMYAYNGNIDFGGGSYVKHAVISPTYIRKDETIRKINHDDIVDFFKLIDTSPVIDTTFLYFNMGSDFVKGFSQEQKLFGLLATQLRYANKPCGFAEPDVTFTKNIRETCKKAIQIQREFNGIDDKPISETGINPLSPLTYDHDPLERFIANIEEGQIIDISPCILPALTGPYSIASVLALANAEVLAGIVFAQLWKPGTNIFYSGVSGATDLRTVQLCMGNPETALLAFGTAALADLYHIPFRTAGCFSDAKDVDFQAGMESMLMGQATADIKPDMILHALGSMGTYNIVSFEKLLLDEEVYGYADRMNRGIDCSDEKFCFDSIKKVGPRGTFLQGRTPKMYREEFYLCKYLNKKDANDWQNAGSESLKEAVQKEVEKRIRSYKIPDITKDQLKLISAYIPDLYRAKFEE